MKRFFTKLLILLALIGGPLMSQTFTHGFAVTSYDADASTSGNVVNVQGTWDDALAGTTLGMYSWTFDVTSADATIAGSIVPTLNAAISANFDITVVSITGGSRVTVTGKTPSKYLIDNGATAATYNTVKITFTAPATGPATIVIVNNAVGTKRTNNASHTPTTQAVTTNTKLTLTVNISTPQPVVVPPTFTDGAVKAGATRKYGDLNWDGAVNVSDVTAILSVANFNYSAVSVTSGTVRNFYAATTAGKFDTGDKEDISDSTVTDISAPTGIDLLDVAVLQDAVLNAEWPSYALGTLSGKPLQKTSGANSVLCEISNQGTAKARLRISLNYVDSVDGVQVFIPASSLNKNVVGYTLIPTANFSFLYNNYENIVALSYSQESGKSLKTTSGVMVLQIPYITVDALTNAKPEFTLSKNNQSVNASYQIQATSAEFLPVVYSLSQNYPNPFNPSTVIGFEVPENSNVNISVYNSLGQQVETLVSEYKTAGTYSIRWNAISSPSGMYYIRMSSGKFIQTVKAVLMK